MKSLKLLRSVTASAVSLAATLCAGMVGATELILNGGFEQNGGAATQVFTGWQNYAQSGSKGGFNAQKGSKSAITPVTVPVPPQGSFSAMSDQPGPGSHVLYQDVAIPSGSSAVLTAKVYVQNAARLAAAPASLDYTLKAPNQQARIDVMDPAAALDDVGGGVLANVFRWPVSATPGPADSHTAYQSVQLDLSSYAGQTVRLRIAEVDNRQSLFFGVDSISITASALTVALPAPSGVALFAQGGTATLTVPAVASTPAQTVTGYVAECTPQGGGAVVSGSSSSTDIALSGLTAGVVYDCRVAARSAGGTGAFSSPVAFTQPATGAVVNTLDGGLATVRLRAPGGGVTSGVLQSVVFKPATAVTSTLPQSLATFPLGLIAVRVSGLALGEQVQMEIELPGAIPAGAQYWKYGPTMARPEAHWYPFDGASSISGNTLTLTLTDGAEGDDDLLKNGVIVDPGGLMVLKVAPPVSAATPVPLWTVSGWLLTSLALFAAMLGLRKRTANQRWRLV